MASWGTTKRNTIIATVFLFMFLVGAILAFLFIYEEPTCFDGQQNGTEIGVDCGGSCELLCSTSTFEPVVHWVRYFKVADGIYNVIAYVENQNPNAGSQDIPFTFKLYDSRQVVIAEKNGTVKLKPRQIIPITISGLLTGKLDAERVTFDFTDKIIWSREEAVEPVLVIKDEQINYDGEVQKISADVLNTSVLPVNNINFVVIVYDRNDNAIAISSTLVEQIKANETKGIFFTWPTNFEDQFARFEIIPVYE